MTDGKDIGKMHPLNNRPCYQEGKCDQRMKAVFKYAIRGFAVLGFFVFMLSVVGWASLLFREKEKLPDDIVLHLDFSHAIKEKQSESPLSLALADDTGIALRDAVAALDLSAKDPRVKIIVGTFSGNAFPLAASEELRAAVLRAREAGKLSYAFATSFGELGPADKAYNLATAFEEIWVQPLGLLGITGFAIETPFAKKALEKIGAQADFVHREEYKNVMETFTQDDFTPESSAMLEDVLDQLTAQFVDDVVAARYIHPYDLLDLMHKAPLTAEEALSAGLIDNIGYADELEDTLLNATPEAEVVGAQHYLALRRQEIRDGKAVPKNTPVVAFIHAVGNIVQEAGAGPAAEQLIVAGELVGAIEDAVNDETVEAILLRLDSPGGSAVASETVRRALLRAQQAGLPVIVSMGSMAASGGYWIASAADRIIANSATLTGSIGVVAGKVAATDELWDKLGLSWSMVTRGENADLWTPLVPFTQEQHNKVDSLVGMTYNAFLSRVADGRGISLDEARAVAKGRVWTGAQAAENGLVDEIGGLYDAIGVTKSMLSVAEDDSVLLKVFPAPLTLAERIAKSLQNISHMGASAARLGILLDGAINTFSPILDVQKGGRQLATDAAFSGL